MFPAMITLSKLGPLHPLLSFWDFSVSDDFSWWYRAVHTGFLHSLFHSSFSSDWTILKVHSCTYFFCLIHSDVHALYCIYFILFFSSRILFWFFGISGSYAFHFHVLISWCQCLDCFWSSLNIILNSLLGKLDTHVFGIGYWRNTIFCWCPVPCSPSHPHYLRFKLLSLPSK